MDPVSKVDLPVYAHADLREGGGARRALGDGSIIAKLLWTSHFAPDFYGPFFLLFFVLKKYGPPAEIRPARVCTCWLGGGGGKEGPKEWLNYCQTFMDLSF